ncbi:MAG: hypothetical protein ACEY3K_02645 [Wolbachia sp.]
MSAKFLILKDILAELKRKNSITVLEEYYQSKWEFYDSLMDLANDEKAYKDLIELANQAKKAVSKYFRNKDIDLQAFYVKTNNSDRVLNINLINYNRSEPIRISDILQQERDISELNIYCDKRHDIYAYRKGKERHYEFKEDAYYEITSTWPVQDKHRKIFTCTMVMNVSSSGITKVLQFNGKDFESPPEEFLELIRQNEELYIQGLSLHDAVKALLEKNKNANIASGVSNLQNNEHIVINKDEKLKDLENDAKSNPILSFTSNNVSEVNPQQVATQAITTQTEVNLQHTETQTEVAVQHVEIQAEIGSQQTDTQSLQEVAVQTEVNSQHTETQTKIGSQQAEIQSLQEIAIQTEVNLQHTETQTEVAVQHVETQTGIGSQETETQNLQEVTTQTEINPQQIATQTEVNLQHTETQTEVAVQHFGTQAEIASQQTEAQSLQEVATQTEVNSQQLDQKLTKAKQKIEESKKHDSDLQDELGEEKQKNEKLQAELTQKDEKLKNISTELQGKIQELEDAYEGKKDLEKKLKISNAEREKLKGEVNKLEEVASENKKEVDHMRRRHDELLNDLKSQMQSLYQFPLYKQRIDNNGKKAILK